MINMAEMGFRHILKEDFKTSIIFGVFLPTGFANRMSEEAVLSDYTGYQKFINSDVGLYANYNYLRAKSGMIYGFELGPNLSVQSNKTDFFGHFGIRGGIQRGKLQFNVEYKGVFIDKFDPFISFLNFEVNLRESFFNPALFFRTYVTGNTHLAGVLGLSLSVSI